MVCSHKKVYACTVADIQMKTTLIQVLFTELPVGYQSHVSKRNQSAIPIEPLNIVIYPAFQGIPSNNKVAPVKCEYRPHHFHTSAVLTAMLLWKTSDNFPQTQIGIREV